MVPNCDAWIQEAIGKNWLTLTLLLMLLNGITSVTKWKWDEKIVRIFGDIMDRLRPSEKRYGNGNNKPPDTPAPPVG